uniref:N-acetyltransferase domain-containing protein n=2 Tax=Phasianus colchicus TaxID=9054 RepID=A0A669QGP2_PHACC
MRSFSFSFVTEALIADLCDIRGSYMRAPDSCFWVAEAGGAVVGMVGAAPSPRGEAMELKRLSVSRDHRGHGISKALCGEVLRFAQARGYRAVVLYTSTVQLVAQRLYERQGFRKVAETSPSLFSSLICFYLIHYRLELPSRPQGFPYSCTAEK